MIALVVMAMIPAVSAGSEKNIEAANVQLAGYYDSPAFDQGRQTSTYVPNVVFDEKVKAELNDDNGVKIRHIGIKEDEGSYDLTNIYNYVKGKSDKPLVLYTGQCLTHTAYERMAIYLADHWGFSVYIVERREVNIGNDNPDVNSIMELWTDEVTLRDYAVGNAFVRIDTGIDNDIYPASIRLPATGHSLGAFFLTLMEASAYDQGLSAVDYIVPVDIIIQFDPQDPQYQELKARQQYHCIDLLGEMGNREGAIQDMKAMLAIAQEAYDHPDDACAVQPIPVLKLTNIQVFRLAAGSTHSSMTWPYNDYYSYWGMKKTMGQPNFYEPLPFVDERALLEMIVKGGAVYYSPTNLEYKLDQHMAENEFIDVEEFDGSHCTYLGINGGFGPYGDYFYVNNGGKAVLWGAEGEGHGGILMDHTASEAWDIIAQEVSA